MVKYNRKRDLVKKRKQSFTSLQLLESSGEKVTDDSNEYSCSGQGKETNSEKKSRFFLKGIKKKGIF